MSGRTARTIRIISLEVSPDLVLLNIRKLDFHDFRHFLEVASSQNTFKWAPKGGPKGPLPWDPLGSQVPLPWGSGTPPMGSLGLPRVPLPWDPFGLSRVPSHGVPIPFRFAPLHQIVRRARHSPPQPPSNIDLKLNILLYNLCNTCTH